MVCYLENQNKVLLMCSMYLSLSKQHKGSRFQRIYSAILGAPADTGTVQLDMTEYSTNNFLKKKKSQH